MRSLHSSTRRWLLRGGVLIGAVVVFGASLFAWNLRPPTVGEPTHFAPPSPANAPIHLRVLTWNVWDLRWITPRREERLAAVARAAAAVQPDIVGFQEAWVATDRQKIVTALRAAGLKHARYFPSGLVGSGVLLVSRFPIESNGFIRFAKGGKPWALAQGDWWAGKGCSLSVVRLPNGLPLSVADTHLHARYRTDSASSHATQLAQSAQLIPWVLRVRDAGSPALWIGDWNSLPDGDVVAPIARAGSWKLLTTHEAAVDNIFGSGAGWEWRVIEEGKIAGFLDGKPRVPWSDHIARWVDVELRHSTTAEAVRAD